MPGLVRIGWRCRALGASALGCGLLALSACGGAAVSDAPPEPGRLPPAIELGEVTDRGMAAVERGQRLVHEGLSRTALAEFERAISINPTLTPAYIGAGTIYLERGELNDAERRFRRAAELEPRNFEAQFGHGRALELLGRLTEAVRAYVAALGVRPNDFDANLNLGRLYLAMGESRQALGHVTAAVRLRPQNGEARIALASTYARLGRHGEAVVEYQQAAELMPLTPELLLSLADSLGRTGRHEESAATLETLLRQEPSAAAYERLGAALFRLRRYADAEQAFRTAIELDDRHYPALNGLAVCRLNHYLWSDRMDRAALSEARQLMRQSLRIERNQPQIVELMTRYR